ncbi:13276_t:CDS:1, partial [Funneliformis geosporum]
LAIQLNDLRKSEKAKEKEGVYSELSQIMPVLETIREILISQYFKQKEIKSSVDLKNGALLAEVIRRINSGDIEDNELGELKHVINENE